MAALTVAHRLSRGIWEAPIARYCEEVNHESWRSSAADRASWTRTGYDFVLHSLTCSAGWRELIYSARGLLELLS